MQIVIWSILLATIGLAALVSIHRRSALATRLDPPALLDGVSVQLPQGWRVVRPSHENDTLLFDATDPQEEDRGLRLRRDWYDSGETPSQIVFTRMRRHGTEQTGETKTLTIDNCPAAIATSEHPKYALALQVAAIVPPGGRAVVVEYYSSQNDSSGADLIKRILDSMQFRGEPRLGAAGSTMKLLSVGKVTLPDYLALSPSADPDQLLYEARSVDPAQLMRRVRIVPVALEARDQANTLRTMLSLSENGFPDAKVTEIKKGEYRIDPGQSAPDRGVRPIRAYALAGSGGQAFLAVIKGGDNESWIQDAWNFIRDRAEFENQPSIETLSQRGASAVADIAQKGLTTIATQQGQQYWLLCTMNNRNFGWVHATQKQGGWSGDSGGGSIESRFAFPSGVTAQNLISFQSSPDLKNYRATWDASFSAEGPADQLRSETIVNGNASLRDGKLNLSSAPGEGESSNLSLQPPANYLPGGWLAELMPALPDEKILVRTDMAWGYEYAFASDLLSVTIETDLRFKPYTDPEGDVSKCKIVQVLGSGERMRWFFDKDGKLLFIDTANNCRFVRRDESEIRVLFARTLAMRP